MIDDHSKGRARKSDDVGSPGDWRLEWRERQFLLCFLRIEEWFPKNEMRYRLAHIENPSIWRWGIWLLFSCCVWEWRIEERMMNRLAWINFHSTWWTCILFQRWWWIEWVDHAKWWRWKELMNRLAQTHFTYDWRRGQWIIQLRA